MSQLVISNESKVPTEQQEITPGLLATPHILLLLLTVISIFVAGPSGNFPTNDDWLYGGSVRSLVENNVLKIHGSSNAFDFIPIYLAASLCKLTGFSYEVLRWTTIAFHLLGISGLYLALRELKTKPYDAAIISSVYAFNPLILNLSLSFMTDIPSLSLCNWSLYFAVAGLQRKKLNHWFLSVLFLTAAMSVRQSALVLLPAIFFAGILKQNSNKDRLLFLTSFSIPALAYACLQQWLVNASTNISLNSAISHLLSHSLGNFCSNGSLLNPTAKIMCYLGLFMLPLSLPLFFGACFRFKNHPTRLSISIILAMVLIAFPLVQAQYNGAYMPYSMNMFMPPIVGAYCLVGGVHFWQSEQLKNFTYVADLAAILTTATVIMSMLISQSNNQHWKNNLTSFYEKLLSSFSFNVFMSTLLASVGAGLLMQLRVTNFDRYYLIALAPFLLSLTPLWNALRPQRLRILALSLSFAVGVYGTIAAADVMNFHRAQWQAIRNLEESGVAPSHIDGGPCYTIPLGGNQFLSIFNSGLRWPENFRGSTKERQDLRWWPVLHDDYVVSASIEKSYHSIDEIKFWSPMFWKARSIYILKSDETTN